MFKFLALTLGFIITIQIGCFLTELVKKRTAAHLGYEALYSQNAGRLTFISQTMQDSFKTIIVIHGHKPDSYKSSKAWEDLLQKDIEDYAKIAIAGKTFTFLVSGIGLLFYFHGRKHKQELEWPEWAGIYGGLFFMCDVVIASFELFTNTILCRDAKIWQYFGLPVIPSIRIYILLGISFLAYLLYSIPQKVRSTFILSGLIGSIAGILLWMLFTGNFVFQK